MAETEEPQDFALPEEAGTELFGWMKSAYLEPEIKRRMEAGALAEGTVIYLAQVVFWVDRNSEVRINEEVKGMVQATATRAIRKGEEVKTSDMGDISGFVLPEEDGEAAHLTMLTTASGIQIYFDGSYNALLIASHVEAADEFLGSAESSLDAGRLRAFAQTAFDATELLAKSEMLSVPEQRLLGAVGHGTIQGFYNQWAKLGNTESRFSALLNRLAELRRSARYIRGDFKLGREEAEELMASLTALRVRVEEVRPKRELGEQRDRRARVVALRGDGVGGKPGPGGLRFFK